MVLVTSCQPYCIQLKCHYSSFDMTLVKTLVGIGLVGRKINMYPPSPTMSQDSDIFNKLNLLCCKKCLKISNILG